MIRTLLALTVSVLALPSPALAHGNVDCKAGSPASWKSVDALKAKLTREGWKIKKAKREGNCYEVYGKTRDGDNVEAFFHPATLERVMVMRRGKMIYRAPGF